MHLRRPANAHYLYIDCARGYAVLMVIACHCAYEFPGLPYTVKRVATSGWFGVQLFFLASCLTLLMSWHAEIARTGSVSLPAFFLRRFFRIAPAYYAAALLYFWVTPPVGGFDLWHAATSAAFVNAWHPAWTPTVEGGWSVVPGGWSISVEFTFYAVFPVFAAMATTWRRVLMLVAAALALGVVANTLTVDLLAGSYDRAALGNFLFFWFPNQASVFALGAVVFFLIRDSERPHWGITRHGTRLAVLSIAAFCLLSYLPLGHYLGDWPPVPAGLAACVPLGGFVIALSRGSAVFVNPIIGFIGRVSFSAYLLHFAILHVLHVSPGVFHTQTVSVWAIISYGCGLGVAITATCACAWLSYRMIELPFINVGKRVIQWSEQRYTLV
jgi:peptidoglycan/LPS O-acetylase OafA/YrhL